MIVGIDASVVPGVRDAAVAMGVLSPTVWFDFSVGHRTFEMNADEVARNRGAGILQFKPASACSVVVGSTCEQGRSSRETLDPAAQRWLNPISQFAFLFKPRSYDVSSQARGNECSIGGSGVVNQSIGQPSDRGINLSYPAPSNATSGSPILSLYPENISNL